MNIICNRNELNYAVALTARAASTKDILDTLGGILLEVDENSLTMTASNLEFTVKCAIDCEVIEMGSVILPASVFLDIVRKSNVDKLEINVNYNNYRTTIKGDMFKMELVGLPGVEFPNVTGGEYTAGLNLNSQELLKMFDNTLYVASKDDIRPIFTGVLMEFQEDLIRLSACDGFRISSIKRECFYKGENRRLVLPGKNGQEIIRLLQSIDSEETEIMFGNGQIMLNIGGVSIYSKLIEGQYPDIVQYLPSGYHSSVKIVKSDLQGSLERAALIIRDSQNGVVNITCKDNVFTVHGKSIDLGQHTEEVAVERDGDDIQVSFTLKYLQDLVKHINSDVVFMKFAEKYNMVVAQPEGDDRGFALLMPVAGRN
ncbi:DNA polymerase III subunit beta [Clostridium sp. 'deep sea']|uniref:DNA polymerase III subunit beta n=1 Tax=Clostridium sp. 'deep sea' TaxID=2779445 RepID=UPI0018964453|nr:DNA polymerase III subunit beta [Clostridium sp. 'deep sea']QOR34102.1 DNA polymerase III subunit beta [Clostridium sp. 'deep sea']